MQNAFFGIVDNIKPETSTGTKNGCGYAHRLHRMKIEDIYKTGFLFRGFNFNIPKNFEQIKKII